MYFLGALVALPLLSMVAASPQTNPASSAIADTSSCACTKLSSLASSELLYPNSPNYTIENTRYWDRRSTLSPACIFLPADGSIVAAAVRIFNECDSPFAIRGGGHMNYPGSNNIPSGVLLALNRLTTLSLSPSRTSVFVGPGNRWNNVYEFLAPDKLYAIGGRLKTIGVPGLTLIGGVHYFANKYGWAMDNVLSYDVVLGNGTQVTASRTKNTDLFWALKGGGNNFGIVTKFELKTIKAPKVSTTIQAFAEGEIPGFIDAACKLAEADGKLGAGAVLTVQYNATTKVAGATLLGMQEGTESPPGRFAEFTKLSAVRRVHNVSAPVDWHSKLDTPDQMFRVQFGHHTIKTDAKRLFEMYQAWRDAVDQVKDVKGLYPTFVLNTAPKSAARIAKTNGVGNTWGLDDSQSMIWWQVSTGWDRAEDDLRMTAWSRGLIDRLHTQNRALGLSSEFVYMGDAAEYQDPFEGFALSNVEKMQTIRSKYDSGKVFTRLNWGGFKLGQ